MLGPVPAAGLHVPRLELCCAGNRRDFETPAPDGAQAHSPSRGSLWTPRRPGQIRQTLSWEPREAINHIGLAFHTHAWLQDANARLLSGQSIGGLPPGGRPPMLCALAVYRRETPGTRKPGLRSHRCKPKHTAVTRTFFHVALCLLCSFLILFPVLCPKDTFPSLIQFEGLSFLRRSHSESLKIRIRLCRCGPQRNAEIVYTEAKYPPASVSWVGIISFLGVLALKTTKGAP